jgi:hypothetical protein
MFRTPDRGFGFIVFGSKTRWFPPNIEREYKREFGGCQGRHAIVGGQEIELEVRLFRDIAEGDLEVMDDHENNANPVPS